MTPLSSLMGGAKYIALTSDLVLGGGTPRVLSVVPSADNFTVTLPPLNSFINAQFGLVHVLVNKGSHYFNLAQSEVSAITTLLTVQNTLGATNFAAGVKIAFLAPPGQFVVTGTTSYNNPYRVSKRTADLKQIYIDMVIAPALPPGTETGTITRRYLVDTIIPNSVVKVYLSTNSTSGQREYYCTVKHGS